MINTATFQRRKHVRYRVELAASLLGASGQTEEEGIPCRVNNLSRYGVCFETENLSLQTSFSMNLRLTVPDIAHITIPIQLTRRAQLQEEGMSHSAELSFRGESERRKLHTFLRSLKDDRIIERRKVERRKEEIGRDTDRRVKSRRRNFGILTEAVSFSSRAPVWQSEYTLYRPTEATSPSRIVIKGRELISYGSNDYLGLSHDPRVKAEAVKALEQYGTSSGSRVLTGTMRLHEEFEQELAEFKGTEAVIVFAGGYLTNVALLTTLFRDNDVAFLDEKAHASIIDGCIYSRAKLVPFRHNSPRDLEAKIRRLRPSRSLIIVDGVYSLEGDLACLPELKAVSTKYNIPLMVDDAHGLGVLGARGSGTVEHFGLNGQIDLDMGTLSGTLGGVGGFVACKKYIADYIRDFSRGFRFTTSLPPATIAGLLEALRIVKTDGGLRARLWSNIRRIKAGLVDLGYQISATESAIISIPIGHEQTTWDVVRLLEARGVYVSPFIRPAVKRGQARIRLTVNALHTDQDISMTLEVFQAAKPEIDAKIRARGSSS